MFVLSGVIDVSRERNALLRDGLDVLESEWRGGALAFCQAVVAYFSSGPTEVPVPVRHAVQLSAEGTLGSKGGARRIDFLGGLPCGVA
jgi:hypothetical protein